MGEGILNIAIKTKVWHSIILFEFFAGLWPVPLMS
jgi:hypothetical protein